MKSFLKLITSILICQLVGFAGSFFTIPSISTWYKTLEKPSFTPPNWVFGPAWTMLFLLMGISLFLVWTKGLKKKNVKNALIFFYLQLLLNFLWSLLFFGLHSPLFALFDIILLWLGIFITIKKFHKISKPASYLLIPYLLWVTFASFLNLFIVKLN